MARAAPRREYLSEPRGRSPSGAARPSAESGPEGIRGPASGLQAGGRDLWRGRRARAPGVRGGRGVAGRRAPARRRTEAPAAARLPARALRFRRVVRPPVRGALGRRPAELAPRRAPEPRVAPAPAPRAGRAHRRPPARLLARGRARARRREPVRAARRLGARRHDRGTPGAPAGDGRGRARGGARALPRASRSPSSPTRTGRAARPCASTSSGCRPRRIWSSRCWRPATRPPRSARRGAGRRVPAPRTLLAAADARSVPLRAPDGRTPTRRDDARACCATRPDSSRPRPCATSSGGCSTRTRRWSSAPAR